MKRKTSKSKTSKSKTSKSKAGKTQIAQFSDQFKDDASKVIYAVWQTIGYDMESAAREFGERLTNAAAVEACIDADRPAMFIKDKDLVKRFEQELSKHLDAVGYTVVLRRLCNLVKLY